jgi:hypothetical protein
MILSDYKRRSPEQQLADLNAAWDRIKTLSATNDRQQNEIQSLKEKLREKTLKLWAMTFVAFGLWEVVKFAIELILKH